MTTTATEIHGRTTETDDRLEYAQDADAEPTYACDLRHLVALASGSTTTSDADALISLTAPPSVREAIRLTSGALPALPAEAPPAPHRADAPPASVAPPPTPRRTLRLAALTLAAVPVVALALVGATLASTRSADRSREEPQPPATGPAIEPPRLAEASMSLPPPVQVIEPPSSSPAAGGLRRAAPASTIRPPRPKPTASAAPAAPPEPPSLMQAITDAVRSPARH